MILGAFGDSFLYGCDLESPDSTWPALVAKNLNLEYSCFAKPGAGNQFISQTITDCVQQLGNNVFYVINWTWIDRFDYTDPDNNWNTIRPSLDNATVDPFYYKHLHSEFKDKLSTLQYVYTALSILQAHECRFVMTYMDSLMLDKTWNVSPTINILQNYITESLDTFDGQTFLDWSRKNQFPESSRWHPLEQAHHSAATYWQEKYEKLLLSTTV